MKEFKLGRKFVVTMTVILLGSIVVNHYVHDHNLKWMVLVYQGVFVGILIGIGGYDYWLRRRD